MFDDATRAEKETEGQPPRAASKLAPDRRVLCELPHRLAVLPGEADLISHLLGELIQGLFE